MISKKVMFVSIILLVLLSIAGINASEVENNTIDRISAETTQQGSDTLDIFDSSGSEENAVNNLAAEKQISKKDISKSDSKKASSIEVTQSNFDTYFEGGVYSDEAEEILLSGVFNGKEFVFTSPVTITPKDANTRVYNSSFNFFEGSDGSSLTNLYIEDKNYTNTVILINEANNIKIQNNTIVQYNDKGETHAITLDISDNSIISGNNITVTGTEYPISYGGMGMTPFTNLSAIHAHQINNNKITNNTIKTVAFNNSGSEVAAGVGIDFYSDPASAYVGEADGSSDNEISGNTIITEGIKYTYSIKLTYNMNNNIIRNNTITSTSYYAYGIEYSFGDNAKIKENSIICNGNVSYGVIYTTNSMGDIVEGLIENNNIVINNASVAYLIEFHGGARSYDTVINNNTLTATGGKVIGVGGGLSNRLSITNNTINISGDSAKSVTGLNDEITPELAGIKISKSSDKVLISGNNINVTDKSNGEVYSLNLTLKNSNVTDNELHSSFSTSTRSIKLNDNNNKFENNHPFAPEPVMLKLDPTSTERSLPINIYLTATDLNSRVFTHGRVVFTLNNQEIGSSNVTEGKAQITFTPELDIGNYVITATYQADDWFNENSTTADFVIYAPYNGIYYVSTNGSDLNDGSINSPKKTVKNAVEMASKAEKNHNIIIMEGTYPVSDIEIMTPLNITGEGEVVLDANHEGLIFNVNTDDAVIKNLKLINGRNKNGGAINATGKLTLANVTFENNNATSYGGAVYSTGSLMISDSKFIQNVATTGGGAIYDIKDSVTITGSEFAGNSANGGGATYIKINSTISDTVFTDNKASSLGGSVYITGNTRITNTSISGSTSKSNGAAIYQSDVSSSLNLTNVNIKDCVSNNSIVSYNNAQSVLDNVSITDSTSPYLVYLNRGNLTIKNSNITDNNCSKSALYSYDRTSSRYSVLTLEKSNIINNTALNMFEARGEIDLVDNEVYDNQASEEFFKVNGNGKYVINGNTFLRNNITNLTSNYYETSIPTDPIRINASVSPNFLDESKVSGKIVLIEGETRNEYTPEEGKVSIPYKPTSIINDLTIKYVDERDNYIEEENTLTIIQKANTYIKYEIVNNTEGNVQINITVMDPTNNMPVEDALIEISGDINRNISNGLMTDTTLTKGKYTINAEFNETEYYKSSETTINLNVEEDKDKIITELKEQINNLTSQNQNITNQLKEANQKINNLTNANKELTQKLEETNKAINELNNTIQDLTKQLKNKNDEIEKLNTIIRELTKPPVNTKITINTIESSVGSITKITANIKDANNNIVNGGRVVFKVNGKTLKDEKGNIIYADVSKGVASINYKVQSVWMKNSTYVEAVYAGNEKYTSSRANKTGILNISKGKATITLDKKSITAKAGQTITLRAKVLDSNGDLVNNDKVVFKINGKTLKDAKGKALYAKVIDGEAVLDYTIPSDYSAKTYTITAVFGGNYYQRTETNGSIKLEKKAVLITPDSVTTKNKKTTVKATIRDETGKLLVSTTKLALKVNGKTLLNNVTSNNGKVSVSFTSTLRLGMYELIIISGENRLYKKGTSSTVLKV